MNDIYGQNDMRALEKDRAIFKAEQEAARMEIAWSKLNEMKNLMEKRLELATGTFPDGTLERLESNKVLEKILFNLTDWVDVVSAYNACSKFEKVLEHKRVELLIPKVFNIIVDKEFHGVYWVAENGKTDIKDLLNLRLVNKSWKKMVDTYLFENPRHENHLEDGWNFAKLVNAVTFSGPLGDPSSSFLKPIRTLSIGSMDGLSRAVRTLMLHTVNPGESVGFVRRLDVSEPFANPEMPDQVQAVMDFRAGILEFLIQFGEFVREFAYKSDFHGLEGMYDRLCDLARLMPNLKTLALHNSFYFGNRDLDRESRRILAGRIREVAFPRLTDLRVCYVDHDIPNGVFISAAIIKENPWILWTQLDTDDEDCEEVYTNLPTSFKPTSLDIASYSIPPVLVVSTWPLKQLQLKIKSWNKPIQTSVLFPLLGKFKDTITYLDIHKVPLWEDQDVTTYLDLPQLKVLEITLNKRLNKVDFMLPMKSLRIAKFYSHIIIDDDDPEVGLYHKETRRMFFQPDEPEKIKFKGFLHQTERSNIAQVFPMLEMFIIQSIIWTRKICFRRHKDEDADVDVFKLSDEDEDMLLEMGKGEIDLDWGESCVFQILGD